MRVSVAAALVLSLCAPVAAKFKLSRSVSISHVVDTAEKQCLNKNVDGATMTLLVNWRPGRLVSKEQGMRLLDACLMKSGQLGHGCLFGDKLCNWANNCLEGNCKNPPMGTALLEVNGLFRERQKEQGATTTAAPVSHTLKAYADYSCTCPGGTLMKEKEGDGCTFDGVFCESCNEKKGFKMHKEKCVATCAQFTEHSTCHGQSAWQDPPLSCSWKLKRVGGDDKNGKCESVEKLKHDIGGMPEKGKNYDFVIGPVAAPGTWIMHCALCNLALNLGWWYQNDKPTISKVPIIKDIDDLIWKQIIPSLTTPEGMPSGKLPDGVKWPIDATVKTTTTTPDPADPINHGGLLQTV